MKHTINALKKMCEWAAESNTDAAKGYATILERVDWSKRQLTEEPKTVPVVNKYLKQCVELAGDNPLGDLGRALLKDSESLHWFTMYQSYKDDKRTAVLHKNYAVLRLTGPKGSWFSDNLTTAISIQGPNTWYPPHAHRQREVYGVIGGASEWLRGSEPIVARKSGEVIYHPSGVRHATWTQEEPLMCFASWIDGTQTPSVFVWE
ncbi:MAG: hypothetical protein HON65_00860 [Rhodospirillales bacterium]|jgi:mannose-6-phosphate isomerase-like protein (cupin superfamily)|nr:hypothetical protein [Rhodospirillales bacterium]